MDNFLDASAHTSVEQLDSRQRCPCSLVKGIVGRTRGRALIGQNIGDDRVTWEVCIGLCAAERWNFAGVEYGTFRSLSPLTYSVGQYVNVIIARECSCGNASMNGTNVDFQPETKYNIALVLGTVNHGIACGSSL